MSIYIYRIGYRIGGKGAGKEMMARGIMAKPGEVEGSRDRLEDWAAMCRHLQQGPGPCLTSALHDRRHRGREG